MCSIGTFLKSSCSTEELTNITFFQKKQVKLLRLRSGCPVISNVCQKHEDKFLKYFSANQKQCWDPFRCHAVPIKQGLRLVNVKTVKKSKALHLNRPLAEAVKLCRSCLGKVRSTLKSGGVTTPSSTSTSQEPSQPSPTIQPSEPLVIIEEEEVMLEEQMPEPFQETLRPSQDEEDIFGTPESMARDNALRCINVCAQTLSLPEMSAKKLRSKGHVMESMINLKAALHRLFEEVHGNKIQDTSDINFYKQIIDSLKVKFQQCSTRSEKMQVLSVLPCGWPISKVMEEFGPLGATKFLVKRVKKLVQEKGIMSSPNPKPGHRMPDQTLQLVQRFYEDPEVSREMPKCMKVKVNGGKEFKPKRLLLANLKELHQVFKKRHPHIKISFSKFAELRPKNCVSAGSSGTHTVCVCTYHHNVKLMLVDAQLDIKLENEDKCLKSYSDCFSMVLCDEPTENCYMRTCRDCLGMKVLSDYLIETFDGRSVDSVTYKQWLSTDRCNLETIVKNVDDFVETFVDKVGVLLEHDFIAKQQAAFLRDKKQNLKVGEVIVMGDFAENYSFVIQDAAQGFHWNNSQSTLHAFVCYFRRNTDSDIEHVNFAVISDCLNHDTVAVHSFLKVLIPFLKCHIRNMSKIFYFSDGAASQYKNRKNVQNICQHLSDFGVECEWHFFATSHGKGPCDGIGAVIKMQAAYESLRRVISDQIDTPIRKFYEWAKNNLKNIYVAFVTKEEVESNRLHLADRFTKAAPVHGIRSIHCIIPSGSDTVALKKNSYHKEEKIVFVGQKQAKRRSKRKS